MITERLALTVVPGAGWRAADVRHVAREAEQANFEAMFSIEVNSDTMTTAAVMGAVTNRLTVGTWIATSTSAIPTCARRAPSSSRTKPRAGSCWASASVTSR